MGLDSNCFISDLTAMREANPRLVQAAAGAGIDALIRSGFGKTSEGLSVTLQTPAFHLLVQQLYARGDNSIVFGLRRPACHSRLNAAIDRRRTTTWQHMQCPSWKFRMRERIWLAERSASRSSEAGWAI
jgi:hypothetical protein